MFDFLKSKQQIALELYDRLCVELNHLEEKHNKNDEIIERSSDTNGLVELNESLRAKMQATINEMEIVSLALDKLRKTKNAGKRDLRIPAVSSSHTMFVDTKIPFSNDIILVHYDGLGTNALDALYQVISKFQRNHIKSVEKVQDYQKRYNHLKKLDVIIKEPVFDVLTNGIIGHIERENQYQNDIISEVKEYISRTFRNLGYDDTLTNRFLEVNGIKSVHDLCNQSFDFLQSGEYGEILNHMDIHRTKGNHYKNILLLEDRIFSEQIVKNLLEPLAINVLRITSYQEHMLTHR